MDVNLTIPASHNDHELLSAAFDATGIGVCIVDEACNFTHANRAFCRLFGYAPEELIGKPWTLLAPPQEGLSGALRAGPDKAPQQLRMRCKDGSALTAIVGLEAVTLAHGARRTVVTVTDPGACRPAQDNVLHHSKDLYREVVENVGEAIIVAQDERLIYGNPRAVELFGYAQQELAHMPFAVLVHPDDLPKVFDRYQRRLSGRFAERYASFRIMRKDGRMVWVESSSVCIDWEGRPATLVFLSDQSTWRKQQEALITSEEHHRQVVNNATEGIIVVQDGKLVFANARMQRLTGSAPEELVGHSLLADVHPDDRQLVSERYTRRMRGEEVDPNAMFRMLHRQTGNITWIEISSVIIEWEGRPATLSFVTDITERKQLGDRLKQSLDERETVLENSIVGMVFLNPAGRVHWANGAMFQIFGTNRIDPMGKSLEPYYPSREEYLKTGAAVLEAVRRGIAYEAELQMRREDGSLFWAYLSGRAVNPNDLSRGTVWVVMDITKRRQLEADLNKSEWHYRLVVENVTECILVVQDGRIVFANPRLAELTGYPPDDLFRLPFETAVHPEDRPQVIDRHLRRLRGEPVEQHSHFRIINYRSGDTIWVELSAVQIEWEGRPATLSFMTDITERRRLEDSLQHSVAERIRLETLQIQGELKEAELARRHAEDNTRAKSLFLANMSHEIRTPMNAIIGMAHLALRTSLDARQRDYIEKIRSAGISLLGIINDILDFSKIEAGKLDMERANFNLDDVLGNVSTVTGARAHEKGLEYLFQVPLDIPRGLVGDPLRLGQILINLINNAIKFTDKGEVSVVCAKHDASYERIQLHFEVRDTGIGMSAEQTAKLFRAFSQADESMTRKYGGTGLGLSIAKRLVELMGGAIWLESKVGVGTTIHFTAWFGVTNMLEQRRAAPAAIHSMRVLVVDDNPSARSVIAQSLAALPLDIDVAAGANAALAMIRSCDGERPYGVVFTDLQMPGMDGIDLIGAVKNDASLASPPRLVLLSSHSREETRYRLETVQADAFLTKPVSASMLIDTLVELFTPDARAGAPGPAERIPRFRDLTVLLVEDNEINQQIATELMQAAGIRVDVAGNGRIALEKLAAAGASHYGLVFMDVQMPDMDGHQATQRIRADARFDALPIVAMTAHAMVEERERCLADGMNDHLTKPIDPALLYHAIGRWCPYHLVQEEATPAAYSARPGGDELMIDGIDVRDGLKRMQGDRAFYLRMLARFRDGQRDAVADIRRALDHDRQSAERFAHTLRGVAAQVGATAIATLAERLEAGMRDDMPYDRLAPLLAQLDAAMGAVWQALSGVLPEPARAAAASNAVFNRDAIQQAIGRFAALLRACDADALDLLDESAPLLAAALDDAAFARIERAARQYDFDAALAALAAGAQTAGYEMPQIQ